MRDPAASMTLLREVHDHPLDPGYEAAAQAGKGAVRAPWWRRVLVIVLAAALGFTSVWAARELRSPAPGASEARDLLVSGIEQGNQRAEQSLTRNTEMINQIESLQSRSLTGADSAFLDHVRELGVSAGSAEVTGPGLVVTLDDSRDAREGAPESEAGFVQDLDLQVLVNALWSAGAEAVGVNGHRLTALSAIRAAGRAIFVDVSPLRPPYVVEAIGPTGAMEAGLARSSGGDHLATLSDVFGISVTISTEEDLTLPGSAARTLRYAEPVDPAHSSQGAR